MRMTTQVKKDVKINRHWVKAPFSNTIIPDMLAKKENLTERDAYII